MTPDYLDTDSAEDVGLVLAAAMFNDPLAAATFPEIEDREALLPLHFEALARYCALFGEVHGLGDPLEAAAIWLTPGETEMAPDKMVTAGLNTHAGTIGYEASERFFGVMEHMEGVHAALIDREHWRLQTIGVAPDAQQGGYGAALLAPVLEEADQALQPVYLETFAAETVAYYENLGFQVMASDHEPVLGLKYWAMLREPAA